MKREANLWIFQERNWQNLPKEDQNIAMKTKPEERNSNLFL